MHTGKILIFLHKIQNMIKVRKNVTHMQPNDTGPSDIIHVMNICYPSRKKGTLCQNLSQDIDESEYNSTFLACTKTFFTGPSVNNIKTKKPGHIHPKF